VTRRLTIVLVVLVAAALLLAGAGTLVLSGLSDRREARADLEEQADDTAALLAFIGNRLPGTLPALRRSLQVDGVSIVPIAAVIGGELPSGVELSRDDLRDLRAGDTASWSDREHLVAAAVVPRQARTELVFVEKDVPLLAPDLTRWLVIASVITLLVAALTGVRLTRRLLGPLRDIDVATRRIAGGDLAARVEVPDGPDELAELARSVNSMAEAIDRSHELERHFLMSVSHDLRTPLTSIRGFAEAVADGAAPDPQRAAGVILGEARRLERLVADLLELAKLDARQFSLRLDAVDLADVVDDAVEAFRPAAAEEQLALEVDIERPLEAVADADRVAQVVANLVENALKHANAAIRVTAAATPDGVVITVADDGPGILPDDLPHVFERLYAGRRQARRQAGSGLGLAIVAELVAAMGGALSCLSDPGQGTAVVVRIPRSS